MTAVIRIQVNEEGSEYRVLCRSPSGAETWVYMTPSQYGGFRLWLAGAGSIQALLPDLTASERELLKTGITPSEWDRWFDETPDE